MLTALIYILTEPLIVLPIIATNYSQPKINETDKERDEDRLTDEREQTICENFNTIILILEKCFIHNNAILLLGTKNMKELLESFYW